MRLSGPVLPVRHKRRLEYLRAIWFLTKPEGLRMLHLLTFSCRHTFPCYCERRKCKERQMEPEPSVVLLSCGADPRALTPACLSGDSKHSHGFHCACVQHTLFNVALPESTSVVICTFTALSVISLLVARTPVLGRKWMESQVRVLRDPAHQLNF